MTVRLQRFDFGTLRDFRGPIVATIVEEPVAEEAPPPPPPPTFSEGEMEAAKAAAQKLGYATGFEAGMAHANAQITAKQQNVDATVLKLGTTINGLQHGYHQLLASEADALSQLVLVIARKVAGAALEVAGTESVVELVTQCLPFILSKPRLMIELHPATFDAAIDRIETLLHASGFEGEIQFRANPALGLHDTTLDWNVGQAQRHTDTLWKEIEALLATLPIMLALPEQVMPAATEQPVDSAARNGSEPAPETPPTI